MCENIYKKALRLHDRVAANLMLAISGRIRAYMGDMDNAGKYTYEAYAEARTEIRMGLVLCAMWDLLFFSFKRETMKPSRLEATVLVREGLRTNMASSDQRFPFFVGCDESHPGSSSGSCR